MKISKNAIGPVADCEVLNLYHNSGDENAPKLVPLPDVSISTDNRGSGARHQSSSANPSESQLEEDSFAAGIADLLNKQVLNGKIESLIIIAAPRTLGKLR